MRGVELGTACAGIKQSTRDDLTVVKVRDGSVSTAVFTRNAFAAAPVTVARDHLSKTNPQWLLINSGNANAGNGNQGINDTLRCCRSLAELTGGKPEQILPFSTGVIGEPLPVNKIIGALPSALDALSEAAWSKAAGAIITTDTRPKGASLRLEIEGQPVIITGICKGAGMIHPNMATMLSFIATDAALDPSLLKLSLQKAVDQSFNRISVDGDTSTNDACVLISTGCANARPIDRKCAQYERFFHGLLSVCDQLAEAIVRDGEGATKLIRIIVTDAVNEINARNVATAVAQSPLVKTAFFAGDPNWGRILAAVGRSGGDDLNISTVSVWVDDLCLINNGERSASYTEAKGQAVMQKDVITVRISLGGGTSRFHMLSCDLSFDYVRINSEYRS